MKELSIEEKAKAYDEAIEYAHYLMNERCKEGTDGSFHRLDLEKMFPELKESEDERIKEQIIWDRIKQMYNDMDDSAKSQVERVFPELAESEDEKTRKDIISFVEQAINAGYGIISKERKEKWIAWLEKQGEHANFRNAIQVGDHVTRNKDGVLVNLSQLKRVAKKDEKQGEQKPTEWSEEDERQARKAVEIAREEMMEKACDAYCKVCGHYAHTTPVYICRQACDYYKDFKQAMKNET